MIHVSFDPEINNFAITITDESVPEFKQLVQRALNCWDDAPKDLKELGDMLTHGKITQDHTPPKKQPKVTIEGTSTPIPLESLPICEYCGARGEGHFYTCPALIRTSKEKKT